MKILDAEEIVLRMIGRGMTITSGEGFHEPRRR
jgi:hypothetical protein